MQDKLREILQHYESNYTLAEEVDEIYDDLIKNNAEVHGNSFYCPIWNSELNTWILLAGTKDKADLWVLKKIIKLIKSGEQIFSILNGNSEFLIKKLLRYNVEIVYQENDVSHIVFNRGK